MTSEIPVHETRSVSGTHTRPLTIVECFLVTKRAHTMQ